MLPSPKKTLCSALLALTVSGQAFAQHDNRFSSRDGGMIGGAGSFSEGSVTVYHHFTEADRQEIDAEIEELKALIETLEGEVQAREERVKTLRQNYHDTRAQMNQMRSRYRL